MTFSIVGWCRRSGMLGVGIATSSICVGARCPHARAGVGAVATQNVTDPALGTAILERLETNHAAADALLETLRNRPHLAYRQVIVVDRNGNTACHSGARILGIHAEVAAEDCFAAGNLLANQTVIPKMAQSFTQHPRAHLAERLLTALEAGLQGGGEQGQIHSAALLVAEQHSFPLVDLRIDWHADHPLNALRALWQAYQPQMDDYLQRALNPAQAPAYGVAGER